MKFIRSSKIDSLTDRVNEALDEGWEYLEMQQSRVGNDLWVIVVLRRD